MGEFSFEVPEGLRGDSQPRSKNNPPPEDFEFSSNGQADVQTTLKRLSQLPEGRELINEAFRDTGQKKIHILDGSKHDVDTKVIKPNGTDPGIILNSAQNADDRYLGADGKLHNVTKEQVLAHEICHLTDFVGKDEYAAVACENDVMDGFDGHVPRASYTKGDDRGTSKFERAGAPLDQHGSLNPDVTQPNLEDIGFGNDQSVKFTGDTGLLAEAHQAGLSIPPHIAPETTGFQTSVSFVDTSDAHLKIYIYEEIALPPLNKSMRCGLLCNKDGKILFIHDAPLPGEVDYLYYDEISNMLSVAYVDGETQESGLTITKSIAQNIKSGIEIQTALIKDKSITELGKIIFIFSKA